MFFAPLTKKTIIISKKELKYKLFFWNKFYGLLKEQITHKLDYIPESWIVAQFSSLHTALVYDTQTIAEFIYMNVKKVNLQIKQMSLDYAQFPSQNRNLDLIVREYSRIRFLKNSIFMFNRYRKGFILTVQIPNYNAFLTTNLIFILRKQIKIRSMETSYYIFNKIK